MTQDDARTGAEDINAVLSRAEATDDLDRELILYVMDAAGRRDPRLADALRRAAIARRFDAEAFRTLLDDVDGDDFERLLDAVLAYTFVQANEDGTFSYDDVTRRVLVEEWRQRDRQPLFEQLNLRLADFYRGRHERAKGLEADLRRVAPLIRRANPRRFAECTSAVEGQLRGPLLDVLYHECQRSPEDAYIAFERFCQEYEDKGRLTVSQCLVDTARSHIEEAAPGHPRLRWLDYWEARVAARLRLYDRAERVLQDLLNASDNDPKLRAWALSLLGDLYYELDRFRESNEAYRAEFDLVTEMEVDPFNLVISYSRQATTYTMAGQLDEAITLLRRGVACAQLDGRQNLAGEAGALAQLSVALESLGREAEALEAALEAFHLVRTQLRFLSALQVGVTERLAAMFAFRHPRLSDTLFAEVDDRIAHAGDPATPPDHKLRYVRALRESGQLSRATTLLAELEKVDDSIDDGRFESERLNEQALLADLRGRYVDAIGHWTAIIERSERGLATRWQRLAALTNRADDARRCGRLDEAGHGFGQAIEEWTAAGGDMLAALAKASWAALLGRRAEFDRAYELIAQSEPFFAGRVFRYAADFEAARAELADSAGDVEAAIEGYARALSIYLAVRDRTSAARVALVLAAHRAECGQWTPASSAMKDARDLLTTLDEMDRYRPDQSALEGDELNARGVRLFSDESGDARERASRAREQFRAAIERVPEQPWYHLNLAYACDAREDWQEAAQAVDNALSCWPAPVPSGFLLKRSVEYRLRHAEELEQANEHWEAIAVLREAGSTAQGLGSAALIGQVSIQLCDVLLQLGAEELDAAEAVCRAGLEAAEPGTTVAGSLRARLALVAARRGDLEQTIAHLGAATAGAEAPGEIVETLVGARRALVASADEYHVLGQALALLGDGAGTPVKQDALTSARLEFAAELYERLFAPPTLVESSEGNALRVEADAELFPDLERTPDLVQLLDVDIPMLREEVAAATGIVIPDVRIVAQEAFTNGYYQIEVHGAVRARGRVLVGGRFYPEVAGVPAELRPVFAPEPLTGVQGGWLEPPAVEKADELRLTSRSPLQFILRHVAAVVERALASFFGIQELRRWLEEVEADGAMAAWHDPKARVRLHFVLRSLVDEGVPIRERATILSAFLQADAEVADVYDVTERVRSAIRHELPRNNRHEAFVLRPEWESTLAAHVHVRDGARFLAAPPEVAEELLAEVREKLRSGYSSVVVATPGLRPYVRQLLKHEHPKMAVLAVTDVGAVATVDVS